MKKTKSISILILVLCMMACFVPVQHASAIARAVGLSTRSMTMSVGQKKTIKLYVGGTACKADGWKSSNTSVATVSKSGVVKAKKKGKANIICDTGFGYNLTCEVTVKGSSKTKKTTKKKSTKAIDFSKYINGSYKKFLSKTSGFVHFEKGADPANIGNIYIANSSEGTGTFFRYDQKTNQLECFQNDHKKNISLYGVKLGMSKSKAKAALKKNNCKLMAKNVYGEGTRTVFEYSKGGHKMRFTVMEGKVTCFYWGR